MSISQILLTQMIAEAVNHEKEINIIYQNLQKQNVVYPKKHNNYFKNMSKHLHNNNSKMRHYHNIKQPGHDVQRFYNK
jgi:hypothetical protein